MGCTVSVQIHPDSNIEELPTGEPPKEPIKLTRRNSEDSYITVHLDDETPVYI